MVPSCLLRALAPRHRFCCLTHLVQRRRQTHWLLDFVRRCVLPAPLGLIVVSTVTSEATQDALDASVVEADDR